MNKTFIPSSDSIQRKWYIIDAQNKTLGRVATKVANILQGKNKINFYPSTDIGDFVIIINAKKINVSGEKEKQKKYYKHSGRPGGMKIETLQALRNRIPEKILEKAIKGMLPKGPLGRKLFTRLKVFKDINNSHIAQKPKEIHF